MGRPFRFIWGPVALVALVFLAFREVSIAVGAWTCERLVTVPECEMLQLEVLLFFGVDLGTVSYVFILIYVNIRTFSIICIHVVYDNHFHYVYIFLFISILTFVSYTCLHVVYDIHVHI